MDAKANRHQVGIIILAAGASVRLGKPKQLLKYKGKSLIERAAQTALAAECENVAVVLGANAAQIKSELENLPLEIVVNEDWATGISSSIKAGLKRISEINPNLSAVVLMLCDQPFVNAETLSRLLQIRRQSGKKIAACRYGETIGVPAVFVRELFSEIYNLQGDTGAKFLIKKYLASEVETLLFSEAAIDIDTPQDYEKLTEPES